MLRTALTATWTALHTFQYGYAISGLNGVQAPLTCGGAMPTRTKRWHLSPCVSMTAAQFGLVVAIFTLGGLTGSLASRTVAASKGQRGTLRRSALAIMLGSALVAVANHVATMLVGRLIVGFGCGLATTTVPIVLADIAPVGSRKALGVMNQLFIVIGLLVAQSLSFPLGAAYKWRGVPAIAVVIAMVQLVGSTFVVLRGDAGNQATDDGGQAEEQPLLAGQEPLTIRQLLKSNDSAVRRGLPLVVITQFVQQACGVSAVMYFSTSILSAVMPGSAKAIALGIVMLKVPITVTPAFLVERTGTRPLLVYPTAVMVIASVILAVGLNSVPPLAVVGMVLFVVAFSVGLGPITWVVLGEVMPPHARAAASSLGLAINWTTNFIVGATFLPLQRYLAGGSSGTGNIFYIFAATCAVAVAGISWGYRVYCQDRS